MPDGNLHRVTDFTGGLSVDPLAVFAQDENPENFAESVSVARRTSFLGRQTPITFGPHRDRPGDEGLDHIYGKELRVFLWSGTPSAPMLVLFDLITKFGPSNATVLILGESGKGKGGTHLNSRIQFRNSGVRPSYD